MGRVLIQSENTCLFFPDMTAITLEIPTGSITAIFVNFIISAASEP